MIARRSDRHSDPVSDSIETFEDNQLQDNNLASLPLLGWWCIRYGTDLLFQWNDNYDLDLEVEKVSGFKVNPYPAGMVLTLTQE